jgi:hypothetical protein
MEKPDSVVVAAGPPHGQLGRHHATLLLRKAREVYPSSWPTSSSEGS